MSLPAGDRPPERGWTRRDLSALFRPASLDRFSAAEPLDLPVTPPMPCDAAGVAALAILAAIVALWLVL